MLSSIQTGLYFGKDHFCETEEAIEAVKNDELSGDQLVAMLRAFLMSRKKLDPAPSVTAR